MIKSYAGKHSWTIESYPGKLKLPGDIVRPLPNVEAANEEDGDHDDDEGFAAEEEEEGDYIDRDEDDVETSEVDDERMAPKKVALWCHSMGGGSSAGSHRLRVALHSVASVVTFVRGCEYFEVELRRDLPAPPMPRCRQSEPSAVEEPAPKRRKTVHWAASSSSDTGTDDHQSTLIFRRSMFGPNHTFTPVVESNHFRDSQFLKSLVSTAQTLESTANRAEARYKELLTKTTELTRKFEDAQHSLHQANARNRALEMVQYFLLRDHNSH